MKNKQPHRISARISDYDYTTPGAYFVTICTHNKECVLGEIADGKMNLNELGCIVSEEWAATGRIRPYVELDAFIVMPNHLHGILILNDNRCKDTARRVPTLEKFGIPVAGSLPTVIRSFKSAVTRRVNLLRRTPGRSFWQHRLYEHCLRKCDDLNRVRKYILNNPARWAFDNENPGVKTYRSQGRNTPRL